MYAYITASIIAELSPPSPLIRGLRVLAADPGPGGVLAPGPSRTSRIHQVTTKTKYVPRGTASKLENSYLGPNRLNRSEVNINNINNDINVRFTEVQG